MTAPTPILTTAPNFRDAGGHATADGRKVRSGLVFRSDGLAALDAADTDAFRRLRIGVVFDLRSEHERDREPDLLPAGVEHVVADVMGHSNNDLFGDIFADPKRAGELMAGDAGIELMSEVYRRFVTTDLAHAAYRTVFTRLAETEDPAVFHCSQGKDRTGWTSAVLLTLLGVPRETVVEDYLDSANHLRVKNERFLEANAKRGFDPGHLRPIFAVRTEYLDTAFDAAEERYGSVEAYVREGMGVSPTYIEALRVRLLES